MSRKITKKSKRRVLLISVITITLISLILVNLFSVWKQLLVKRNEKVFYSAELKKLEEEEAYLKVEAEKLQDPDYVARFAREQYLYSKDGELNIRIK
ncbi:MAG: septum formation initiator family protein [Bacilli bacterium]|nr:septum formation initiator family protein [Bacilli bacterium]